VLLYLHPLGSQVPSSAEDLDHQYTRAKRVSIKLLGDMLAELVLALTIAT
jgi:hypothetical protein